MARKEHDYRDFERFAGKDVSDRLSEAPWNDLDTLCDAGIAVSVTKDDLRHCFWVYVNRSDPGYPCQSLREAAYFISGLCLGITGTCYHIIDYHKHQPMWLKKDERREAMEWEEDGHSEMDRGSRIKETTLMRILPDRQVGPFVARAFGEELVESVQPGGRMHDGVCAYCERTTGLYPLDVALSRTLRGRGIFWGDGMCKDCTFVLLFPKLRTRNWMITRDANREVKREEVWRLLFGDIEIPNLLLFPTNYRHSVICAEINRGLPRRSVVWGQDLVTYDLLGDRWVYEAVQRLYVEFKQPKRAILSGELSVVKLGVTEFMDCKELSDRLEPVRGTIFLRFLIDFLTESLRGPDDTTNR